MDETSLKTTRTVLGGAMVVRVDGDLDIYTAPQLRAELGRALTDSGDVPVAIDLRNIGFLDSAGLAALLWARSARRESQYDLSVVVASGSQPERVFRLAGLETLMTVVQDPTNIVRAKI